MNLESEPAVVTLDEDGKSEDKVSLALECLLQYDPSNCWNGDTNQTFHYWKIRVSRKSNKEALRRKDGVAPNSSVEVSRSWNAYTTSSNIVSAKEIDDITVVDDIISK